ncbi:prepilin peptidase [Lentibacillus saliphilus]|uniref:prepilin peptidase n=1 Tax=Lentibacillus saliphilus TaxID=2737028 RepID=UPI001C2F780F|nr:A24 family peptidase [Lentibacillus saliphilus]
MNTLLISSFFLFGIIVGSFLNVVGLRLPIKQSFVHGRSECPHCTHPLKWYDLIPLISYIIQRQKCRYCHKNIAPLYPIVELSTGLLFAFSVRAIGLETELMTALLLIALLMIILVSDLTYMIIPNRLLLFFFPLFILMRLINPLTPWWSSIAGALGAMILLALIILISKGGMGAGDMKLFGVIGIVLGFKQTLLAFFLSTIIGALIGIILLMTEVIGRKQQIPFGPYIVIGTLLTYFFGENLANWYFELLI